MPFTDPRVAEVFEHYAARHRHELELTRDLPTGSFGERRDEFLLPVGAEVGAFLRALAVGRKPARILELGTSYGYSTLFLADAARQCGAQVVTVDLDPAKQAYARDRLEEAGLADFVEFRCGDALEIIAGCIWGAPETAIRTRHGEYRRPKRGRRRATPAYRSASGDTAPPPPRAPFARVSVSTRR